MRPAAELKNFVREARALLARERGLAEFEIYCVSAEHRVARLAYTSDIPCRGVEELKSHAADGFALRIVTRHDPREIGTATEAGDLSRQRLGDRPEPTLEGATGWVAAILHEELPKGLHLGLLQDGEEAMHFGQMSDDHDHQRLQEQAVRVGLGPASPVGRGRHRDTVDQPQEGDKDSSLGYHMVVSVLGCGNHMVRDRRAGLLSGAVRYS